MCTSADVGCRRMVPAQAPPVRVLVPVAVAVVALMRVQAGLIEAAAAVAPYLLRAAPLLPCNPPPLHAGHEHRATAAAAPV